MSEKKSEKEIPEGLPERLSEINADMTNYMAGIRADRESGGEVAEQKTLLEASVTEEDAIKVGAAAARRTFEDLMQDPEVSARLNEPDDVHSELGHGDRKKMRLSRLAQELADGVHGVHEIYDPLSKRDLVQYKLQHAQLAIAQMGSRNIRSIEYFVEDIALGSRTELTREDKMRLIRLHDSLSVLLNAFQTGDEFAHNRKSDLWENPAAKEATLHNNDVAYKIIEELSSPGVGTVTAFMNRFQIEILKKVGVPMLSRRGASPQSKRGRATQIKNLQIQAWQNWDELPEETTESQPISGQDAEVIEFPRRNS